MQMQNRRSTSQVRLPMTWSGALLLLLLPGIAFGAHEIRRYVVGGGGGMVSSGNHSIRGTIGQPVVGNVQSASYELYSGFWVPMLDPTSDVSNAAVDIPENFLLFANRPNPFHGGTTIGFGVPWEGGAMKLRIFDINGRLVRTLVDGERSAGYTSEFWNGRDDGNRVVGSGVYFYQLESRDGVQKEKMIFLR